MPKLIIKKINYQINNHRILEDISFEVNKGEILTLYGKSGCGKSTLIKIIAGLLTADSGEIIYENQDLNKLKPHQRSIGYVAQTPSLLPHLNVIDNICLGLTDHKQKNHDIAIFYLNKLKISGLENRYPHQLSVGQQQKISIIRALIRKPKIILFDEPYANLDQENKENFIKETMRIVKESSAIKILVTHSANEIKLIGGKKFKMEAISPKS